jgi:uncharacterized coiled-coil DUF342 family protein
VLDIFPSVRDLKSALDISHSANELAADILRKQNDRLAAYRNVIDQVVAQRDQLIKDCQSLIKQRDEWKSHADNGWAAAKEWKGLSEHLQAQFAMLEQRGAVH